MVYIGVPYCGKLPCLGLQEAFSVAAEVFEEEEAGPGPQAASLVSQMQLQVDVTIIGAGPAGTLLAYLLAEQYDKPWASGCCVSTLGSFMAALSEEGPPNPKPLRKVFLVDPLASKKWPNNYGVWQVPPVSSQERKNGA